MNNERSRHSVHFKGKTYPTKKALCSEVGVSYETAIRASSSLRLRRFTTVVHLLIARKKARDGLPLTKREALLKTLAKKRHLARKTLPEEYFRPAKSVATPVEYLGVQYESMTELCNTFQISDRQFRHAMSKYKCSPAEAIDRVIKIRDKTEIRAFGTVYKNLKELAQHKKVNLADLKSAKSENPHEDIEKVVKSLRIKHKPKVKARRSLPKDAILFGWEFPSWKAAWEYWKPLGVGITKFYDYLAEGADIDARCHHELIVQAERGNLTKDLRRLDQIAWSPKQGGPVRRVKEFSSFNLKERLAPYELKKPPKGASGKSTQSNNINARKQRPSTLIAKSTATAQRSRRQRPKQPFRDVGTNPQQKSSHT